MDQHDILYTNSRIYMTKTWLQYFRQIQVLLYMAMVNEIEGVGCVLWRVRYGLFPPIWQIVLEYKTPYLKTKSILLSQQLSYIIVQENQRAFFNVNDHHTTVAQTIALQVPKLFLHCRTLQIHSLYAQWKMDCFLVCVH